MTYYLHEVPVPYIIHVKIQLFVTVKSDQDPDSHGSGSALREKAYTDPH
jgi:hypothetical protein